MEFGTGIEHLQLAYLSILKTAGPILAVALAVGLLIGILQAATSINEATLSFVPKLVIVFITMALLSSYMLTVMTDYFLFVFDSIRSIR
jgi:flagellar biosynthesis protein FliQ